MKKPLTNLKRFLFFTLLILAASNAKGQFPDTLKPSSFFYKKYGNSLAVKLDSISDYYKMSIVKSISIGDTLTYLNALINLADLNGHNKNIEQCFYYLSQAEDFISKHKIDSHHANYQINYCYARFYFTNTDYPKAIKHCHQALDIYINNSYDDNDKLNTIYYLLNSSYLVIKNYDSSLLYLNKSDSLLSSITANKKWYFLKNAENRGLILEKIGNRREALNELLKALDYIDEDDNSYQIARIYNNIANNYYSFRELDKSIQYYIQSIKIYQKLNSPKFPYITNTNSAMARVYILLGNGEKALELLKEGIEYRKLHEDPSLSSVYQAIANAYMTLDSLDMADRYLRESIKVLQEDYKEQKSLKYANAIFYYGHFLIERLHNERGVELTSEAINIYKNLFGEKHPSIADCYDYLGKAKILIDKSPDEALYFFQKALIANDKTFNNFDINTNPEIEHALSRKYLLAILTDKADALHEKIKQKLNRKESINDIELLNQTLLLAINTIDNIRTSFNSVDSKLKMNEQTESLYSKLILSSIDLYNITNDKKHLHHAYEYTENSKLATLNGLIKDDMAKITAGVPEELLDKEKHLRIKKSKLNNQLYNLEQAVVIDQEKKDRVSKKLFKIDQEIDLLTAKLEKNYKNYYHLKYKNERLGVKDLQKHLSNNQAVIEYFLTKKELLGFAITKDSLVLTTINIDSTFYANIESLTSIFKQESFTYFNEEQFNSFKNIASYLYGMLVEPVNDLIKDKDLIIIPDKELLQLPFEVLISDKANDIRNYRNLPYLMLQYPISYSYSSEWLFTERTKKKTSKKLLAIVPSYNNEVNYEDLVRAKNNSDLRDVLLPIPAALEEAESIIESISGDILKSDNASELKFKNVASQYSILHFAAHTIIDNNNPMFSKLVFTNLEGDSSNVEDNFLNTHEIFNLELNAQMVVLSSCNSGSGSLMKGEGIMSMARGFIFAGSPSLAITLWSIDDQASADLMSFYYQNLAKGMNKAKALQEAKIAFLKIADPIRIHPHFWASHVLIGNTNPIQLRDGNRLIGLLVFAIIILIVFFLRKKLIRALK